MTTNIKTAMQEHGRGALRGFAVALSLIVYGAALIYAGVRSYDLFARTLPADMISLALLGIVALEVTALGLPLAIHFWTSPGQQRLIAFGFYGLDLLLIIGNSILDAAQNAGTILPGFMQWYGVFAVPGLPVFCMIGWALIWMTDPTTREHDMRAAVRAATREALFERITEETASADIGEDVRAAAAELAREIVGETLARAPRRLSAPSSAITTTTGQAVAIPKHANGTEARARVEAVEIPKG